MDSKIPKELGDKLKAAREKVKLTQAEVAEKTDMTATYYAMIERGEVNLTYDKLRKLLKLLKMKPSELPL
jgi:transcriptional regulator with XRE-family HTH domain